MLIIVKCKYPTKPKFINFEKGVKHMFVLHYYKLKKKDPINYSHQKIHSSLLKYHIYSFYIIIDFQIKYKNLTLLILFKKNSKLPCVSYLYFSMLVSNLQILTVLITTKGGYIPLFFFEVFFLGISSIPLKAVKNKSKKIDCVLITVKGMFFPMCQIFNSFLCARYIHCFLDARYCIVFYFSRQIQRRSISIKASIGSVFSPRSFLFCV